MTADIDQTRRSICTQFWTQNLGPVRLEHFKMAANQTSVYFEQLITF